MFRSLHSVTRPAGRCGSICGGLILTQLQYRAFCIYFVVYVQYRLNEVIGKGLELSATERFIEEMGLISQQHGNARIAGRIVGLLMIEGRELSLQEISERLGVSRASVSTNARHLARSGTLRLTAHPGSRQDYYELTGAPYFEMLDELALQFQRHAKVIDACVASVHAERPDASPRIRELSGFYEKSAEILQNWAIALRDEKTPGKERP